MTPPVSFRQYLLFRTFSLMCLASFTIGGTVVAAQLQQRASRSATDRIDVWIDTGRSPVSHGIDHCTLDMNSGKLSQPTLAAEAQGPGFLAMHPHLDRMFAVCDVDGKPSVAEYVIDRTAAAPVLKLNGSLEIGDGGGTHICLDRTSRTLLTAQYGGGSVAVFHLNEDGSLSSRSQLVEHRGGSQAVAGRQDSAHPHWVGTSPDNRFAFVPDLGMDEVVIYQLDAAASRITPHGFATCPPGSGPRHMKFHRDGRHMLVLNELALTISVFAYNRSNVVAPSAICVIFGPDSL